MAPSAAYLRMLLAGLRDGQGWDADTAAGYLAGCPGALGHWSPADIRALATNP